jgi:ABC-type antimicrobial peptide transport system permease subunit
MALGAARGDVLRLVLGQGWRLVAGGVVLGVAGSVWTSSLLSRLLFGISPTSPVALSLVAFALGAVATIACAVPAMRAARVSPLVALRK